MKRQEVTVSLDGEMWRGIPEFSNYEASNFGRIQKIGVWHYLVAGAEVQPWMSDKLGVLVRSHEDPAGYVRLAIYDDAGKQQHRYVHRLIAAAWLGPCPPGVEVHHINHVRNDNRLENLTYTTVSENRAKRRPRKKIRCPHCHEELW